MHWNGENAYGILVGKCEGKRPLGRPDRVLELSIQTDLKRTRREGVDWIRVPQDTTHRPAFLYLVINLRVS